MHMLTISLQFGCFDVLKQMKGRYTAYITLAQVQQTAERSVTHTDLEYVTCILPVVPALEIAKCSSSWPAKAIPQLCALHALSLLYGRLTINSPEA